ncbi:GNAT family N-acetyltransferase [Rheinheimera gaetbuli]
MIEIETSRLLIKPLQQQQWPLFLRLHSDAQIVALCFDVPGEREIRQKFASRLQSWTPDNDHWLGLVVTDKASGAELGVSGFFYYKTALPKWVICFYLNSMVEAMQPKRCKV